MGSIKRLSLPVVETGTNFFYDKDKIDITCEQIEEFLKHTNIKNTVDFTRSVLFPYEIKFNNTIEGYHEDIESIIQIINNPNKNDNKLKEEYQRVRNLMVGYKYILSKKEINKYHLRALYELLSANLLEPYDVLPPGEFYRSRDVYIYFSSRMDVEPDMGMDPSILEEHMNLLLQYIDNNNEIDSISKAFVKSQIMHYYFVYLHPYYDINGRTSRTLSLWYLIRNEAHYFTIFNRGVPYSKNDYYKLIREAKATHNLTKFLLYMTTNVKKEMQKEHIINSINNEVSGELSSLERQTLQYILESKVNTMIDFCIFYNRFNKRKKVREVYDSMLLPLLEKEIIVPVRETKKVMFNGQHNFVYELNGKKMDDSILKR